MDHCTASGVVSSNIAEEPYAPPKARYLGFEYIPAERQLLHSFFSSKLVQGALLILLLLVLCAVFAYWIAPVDPLEQMLNARLKPPIWQERGMSPFYLGTDRLGRDVLSNIIFGLRISLLVGFVSVGISLRHRPDPGARPQGISGASGRASSCGRWMSSSPCP